MRAWPSHKDALIMRIGEDNEREYQFLGRVIEQISFLKGIREYGAID